MEARKAVQLGRPGIGTGRRVIPVVLFVSGSVEDARTLRQLVGAASWVVVNVPELSGAYAAVRKERPKLVVCDTDLDGPGSWRDLLKWREDCASFPLAVASRNADDALWTEVLDLGGLDLLRKPFTAEGVYRVIEATAQASRRERVAAAYKSVLHRARWNWNESSHLGLKRRV